MNNDTLSLLKDDLKKKAPVIGLSAALKSIKNGKARRIYVSKNCPENIKEDLKRYTGLFKAEYYELNINSEEVGTLRKKLFQIAVLSYE
jgi:ribosomal protein L30E